MFTLALVRPCIVILPPLFINLILKWTAARQGGVNAKVHVALSYVIAMFCAQVAASSCSSYTLMLGRRLNIRVKALIIAEVFNKSLRRKDLAGKALLQCEKDPKVADSVASGKQGEESASAGKIQNLVGVDASRSQYT